MSEVLTPWGLAQPARCAIASLTSALMALVSAVMVSNAGRFKSRYTASVKAFSFSLQRASAPARSPSADELDHETQLLELVLAPFDVARVAGGERGDHAGVGLQQMSLVRKLATERSRPARCPARDVRRCSRRWSCRSPSC